MSIIYDESSVRGSGPPPVPYHKQNACAGYLRHFGNLLFLQAVALEPKSTQEKIQATREMAIAERKMTYWARHPNFSLAKIDGDISRMKREWHIDDRLAQRRA